MRHRYTDEQKAFLCEGFKTMKASDLTAAFNQTFGTRQSVTAIRSWLKGNGVRSGRPGRMFTTGHRPWNKGIRDGTGPRKSSFRKGHEPWNRNDIGHERYNGDKGCVTVKVKEDGRETYRPKHHVVWERHNGPVPKGHVLVFRDGDRTNCAIDNLECLSLAENLHMVTRLGAANYPEGYRPTLMLLARLEVRAFERGREGHKQPCQPK